MAVYIPAKERWAIDHLQVRFIRKMAIDGKINCLMGLDRETSRSDRWAPPWQDPPKYVLPPTQNAIK